MSGLPDWLTWLLCQNMFLNACLSRSIYIDTERLRRSPLTDYSVRLAFQQCNFKCRSGIWSPIVLESPEFTDAQNRILLKTNVLSSCCPLRQSAMYRKAQGRLWNPTCPWGFYWVYCCTWSTSFTVHGRNSASGFGGKETGSKRGGVFCVLANEFLFVLGHQEDNFCRKKLIEVAAAWLM